MALVLYIITCLLWSVFCYRVQTKTYNTNGSVFVNILNFIFCPISMIIAIKNVIPKPPKNIEDISEEK